MSPLALKIDASVSIESKSQRSIMASVEAFKSAVVRIRDIFRGLTPSITGMESMRHICLYLLSLYMTKDNVKSLGVPDEFAWENLIETAQTKNGGVQKALDFFFNKETDCLVNHFDRLFGTRDFSFDIKNPAKHKEILELLSNKDIDIKNIDLNMDILGWVYEQHLGKGSGGSAMRDLGQFFTDRFICDYMVTLCKPGFKSKGVPESICDPSMGTGGFLTSYMKFYKKTYTDNAVNWSVQNKEIHGCDTDQKVAGVARLNLFMESGGSVASNLLLRNSLNEDLTQTGYDLILANMPFGLKGIIHAECCERVKALKIRGTKSEPLFLQLMMVSLNRGGRCAVVVPDGMLVNGSSCHDETRKYLLDNFELKRVIKMKGQFFMNTGIQPSILFFENTGKPTSAVEFWDVIKGANGDIEETMVLSVPRAKFDASCSFDMRRYQEVKAVANPAGFPMVKLEDIIKIIGGKRRTIQEATEDGEYDFITCSIMGTSRINVADFTKEAIIINAINGSGKCRPYYSNRYSTTTNNIHFTLKDDCKNVILKYLYRYLELNSNLLEEGFNGGNQKKIGQEYIKTISILLPPLEIQQEIVATLDRIYAPGTTELAETLKLTDKAMDLVLANPGGASLEPIVEAQRLMRKSAQMVADVKAQMVADVKAQMVALVKASCSKGIDKPLTEVCKTKMGFPFKSSDYTTEGLIVVKHNNITDEGYVKVSKKQDYIPSTGQTDDYKLLVGDIVVSMDFDCGKVGKVVEPDWVLNQRVCLMRTNTETLLQEYLYWLLRFGGFYEIMQSLHTGTTIKHIGGKDIDKAVLKVPSIEIQTQTLQRLDALQTQLTSLENLGKQAEDNARFILDSYLNTA